MFLAETARRFGVVLSLCLSASSALAVEDELFFGELPVVASVSRLPQRIQDAPAAVTIIDRQMIKAMGMRDLNDLLRIVPGFQTFVRTIESPRVTYHGLVDADQSSRVQVLVDGRSLFSPLFDGGVNWSLIPAALEDIERIEVTRGSSAISHGGNAFQALVNIVTVDPSLAGGTTVSASHGNQKVRDYLVRHGGKLGASGDFRLTYQSRQDSGLNETWTRRDGYQSQLLDGRADFAISADKALQLSAGYMASAMPHVDGTGAPDSPYRDQTMSTAYLQAVLTTRWLALGETQWRYAFSEDRLAQRYEGTFSGMNFVYDPNGSRASRHEFEVIQQLQFSDRLRSALGLGHRIETLYSPLYFGDSLERARSSSRVFGSMEWRPQSWLTLNLGASLEEDSLTGSLPSSRASLNLHLDAENSFRFGASSSQRAGSRMNYQGGQFVQVGPLPFNVVLRRGNPDLEAEKLRSVEAGYTGNWKSVGLQLDARAFREHVPNRWFMLEHVYADCNPPRPALFCLYNSQQSLRTVFPIQDVRTRGAEYQMAWRPSEKTSLFLTQAVTRIRAEFLPEVVSADNRELSSPDRAAALDALTEMSSPVRSTSVLWIQKLPYGFELSSFAQWVGRMKWTQNSATIAYNRVDVRLGYPFRAFGQSGEIAFTAQSMDGPHYERRSGGGTDYANPGQDGLLMTRRQWLSLRLDF